jgi:hypothetical protein
MTFAEDTSPIRIGSGPHVLACLRSLGHRGAQPRWPVNLATTLRHHSRDHTDRSPPLAADPDEPDNTQERRSPALGQGITVA